MKNYDILIKLKISRDHEAKTDDLFFSFNNNLGNSILAYLLVFVFALIGFILLIIPGIIVALFYKNEGPKRKKYQWEIDEELEKGLEEEFLKENELKINYCDNKINENVRFLLTFIPPALNEVTIVPALLE